MSKGCTAALYVTTCVVASTLVLIDNKQSFVGKQFFIISKIPVLYVKYNAIIIMAVYPIYVNTSISVSFQFSILL